MLRDLVVLVLAVTLQMASVEVNAGNFAVNPVRITLDNRHQPVAALTVRNSSDVATVVQAEVMQWSAGGGDGDDQLQATTELLVTPAVFTLPPRGQQVVRVGLRQRQQQPSLVEGSFRLYLTEVPAPPEPGFRGLNVALRVGLPVFVKLPGSEPRITLALLPSAPGILHLQARNSGTAHLRLKRVVIDDGRGVQLLQADLMRDVLVGQVRSFKLPMANTPAAQTELSIQLHTELGVENFKVHQPG